MGEPDSGIPISDPVRDLIAGGGHVSPSSSGDEGCMSPSNALQMLMGPGNFARATPAAQAATTAAEASTEKVSNEEESGEEQRGQYDGRVEEMRGETTEEVSDEEESGEEQRGQHSGMVEEMRGESTEEVF